MCGRFSQTKSKQEIKKRFNVKTVSDQVVPLFNIAPDVDVPVILNAAPQEVTVARWGLVPSWAKEEKSPYSMINARAETLLEKPAYKRLVKNRRCLVIADSFYEWKKTDGKKQPYRIMLKDDELFAFAGLWDVWEKEGKKITSCTIITTSPNKLVASIHDRMPVILDPAAEKDWLEGEDPEKVLKLLSAYQANKMKSYAISTAVNNPSNNSEDIIKSLN